MKKILILSLILIPQIASAQAVENRKLYEQERLLEEEYRKSLAATEVIPEIEEKFKLDYGGWVSSIYRTYKNLDNDSDIKDLVAAIWTADARLWAKLTLPYQNDVYVRLRNQYNDKKNISDYGGEAPGWDNDGPFLDMGYVTLTSGHYQARAGRQYFNVGRGIAYSNVHDGVSARAFFKDWVIKSFISQTLPHEENIDYSVPGYDKKANHRIFYGFETAYLGLPQNAFYFFFLNQRDQSGQYPINPIQDYRYFSYYIGIGNTGKAKNLTYWTEVIKEFGRTYTDVQTSPPGEPFTKKYVSAIAANTGLRYQFPVAAQPATEVEFAYGSGSKYRTSPTNTRGGMADVAHKDSNFLYFGNYYAGYALSPRLSNMYIYKVEQSVKPFFFSKIFKDVAVGMKYFIYYKANKYGGMSDPDAILQRSFIGREFNYYAYWIINKDLYFLARYGVFYPGNAYDQDRNSNTHYFYTRLTYTF